MTGRGIGGTGGPTFVGQRFKGDVDLLLFSLGKKRLINLCHIFNIIILHMLLCYSLFGLPCEPCLNI